MNESLHFETRDEFRIWLINHCMSGGGIWLKLEKPENTAFKTGDAPGEALCSGWIDGAMKRIDDEFYIKYFSAYRENSKWFEKNKALVEDLEKRGLMTDSGREKIQEVRRNGQWGKPSGPPAVIAEQTGTVVGLLKEHEPACINFWKVFPSVQETYIRTYCDARIDDEHARRFVWMVERLEKSLKPT